MSQLFWGALDKSLMWCPNLHALRVSADYISDVFFESESIPNGHPLRILDLDCSDFADVKIGINPDAIWVAIDNGCLPDLRSIRVSARLAWQATHSLRSSVSDLLDLLQDQEKVKPIGIKPGIWNIVS